MTKRRGIYELSGECRQLVPGERNGGNPPFALSRAPDRENQLRTLHAGLHRGHAARGDDYRAVRHLFNQQHGADAVLHALRVRDRL